MAIVEDTFDWRSGDTLLLTYTITDDAEAAVDVSSGTFAYQLNDGRLPTDTAQISKSSGSGIAVSGASSNIVTITVAAADSAALAGIYWHELQVTDGSSQVKTIMWGHVTFKTDAIA